MSGEDWWSTSGTYNIAIFPMQIIAMVTGITLTYFLFAKPSAKTNNLMKAYLAFTFAWNGTVFFLIYGKELPGTFLGAPLFIITAVLFAADILTKKTEFKLPDARWHNYITIFWILCAFLYPLIGLPLGHYYPKTCIFGVFPCPTTVFALALLAAATPKVDKKAYILLLIWALPSIGKCFGALNLQEDCILFIVGVYGLIMLVKNWKARARVLPTLPPGSGSPPSDKHAYLMEVMAPRVVVIFEKCDGRRGELEELQSVW